MNARSSWALCMSIQYRCRCYYTESALIIPRDTSYRGSERRASYPNFPPSAVQPTDVQYWIAPPMRRQALHYIVSARRASSRNSSDFALNSVEDQSVHGGADARHRFVPRIPRGHSFGPVLTSVLLGLLNITREQCIALDAIASASHVMIIFDCGRE